MLEEVRELASSDDYVAASPCRAARDREWMGRICPTILAGAVYGMDALLLFFAGLFVARLAPLGMDGAVVFGSIAGSTLSVSIMHRLGAYEISALKCVALQVCFATAGTCAAVLLLAAALLANGGRTAGQMLQWMIAWVALGVLLLPAQRLILAQYLVLLGRNGRLAERVGILGATRAAADFLNRLQTSDSGLVEVVGVFDADVPGGSDRYLPVAGDLDDLISLSRRERVDTIILAFAPCDEAALKALSFRLSATVADIVLLPSTTCTVGMGRLTRPIADCPLLMLEEAPLKGWNSVLKVGFDYFAATLIAITISPVLMLLVLAIKLDSPGPVFFRQRRVGYNDRVFDIFKFRTMYHQMRDPNADRLTTRNDPRVTRIGRWLRKWSLDEVPQLLNVLRGEMSLVGPRPHPLGAKAKNRLYAEVVQGYSQRHRIKPGITGLAQVNGWRGETVTEDQILHRVSHDLDYIHNWSFGLDLRILLLTVWRSFRSPQAF